MEIWPLANQKGGCGKTTTAVNLAAALAAHGERVLLVDLDPQAHATLGLGQSPDPARTIAEALLGRCALEEIVRPVPGGIDLAPASLDLAEVEGLAEVEERPQARLRQLLEASPRSWDWVLVDCPPRVDGLLTQCALMAATTILLVVETGAYSLQGAVNAEKLFRRKANELGARPDVKVVGTLFDRRTRFARDVLVGMQERFGAMMFDTAIRESVRLREAAGYGVPVQELDRSARATADFDALADEVLAYAARRRASRSTGAASSENRASETRYSESTSSESDPSATDPYKTGRSTSESAAVERPERRGPGARPASHRSV